MVSFGVSVPEAVGDASSFEAFFEAESASLFRRLCLVTGNRHEAEEVKSARLADGDPGYLEAYVRGPYTSDICPAWNVEKQGPKRGIRSRRTSRC